MNEEIKKCELLEEAVNAENWSEAKRLAKTCPSQSSIDEGGICMYRALIKLCRNRYVSYPSPVELEIIRIIYNKGISYHHWSRYFVFNLECEVIDNRDWKRLESLVDDAPLDSFFIGKLVSIAENDLDNKDAIRIIDKHIKVHRSLYGVKYSRNKIIVKRMVKKILRKILKKNS